MVKKTFACLMVLLAISVSDGFGLSSTSDPSELRAYISRMEKVERPTAEQSFRIACARWWLHDNSGALVNIGKAIELDPKASEYRLLRGLLLKASSRYAESLSELNKAVELGSTKPELFADRAYVRLMLKDFRGALADADKCLSFRPKDATSWFVKGGVLLELKQASKAIDCLNKAIESDPTDPVALRLRALAYKQLGRTSEAEADFSKAHSLDHK